jgi:hypothetical protein
MSLHWSPLRLQLVAARRRADDNRQLTATPRGGTMGMMQGGGVVGMPSPRGREQNPQMIERRMDMMQMMMEQMVQNQQMMESPAAR